MLDIFEKWYRRYFFEEESILLVVLLAVSLALLLTIGDILTPVLASMVLAYLADGMAARLRNIGVPQYLAFVASYLMFFSVFFGFSLGLLPLVWRQLLSLAAEMPRMLDQAQQFLVVLPERYPTLVNEKQLGDIINSARGEIAGLGQMVVTRSLASIAGLLTVMVYMVLIPILVFFFLKDRDVILGWMGGFLPSNRPFLRKIWGEMNLQVANYARGKALEMLIVGGVSYFAFKTLGLNYSALLALLVGLSVIIPYLGAALVTIPVVIVAFFQWGIGIEFYWLFGVYVVIQALDGNLLVPLLFSEAVNLHPVAIILAVLFFGGIWGLWGVFFAIPLATFIKAIINAWPRSGPRGDDELSGDADLDSVPSEG
jgi:putative permease